MKREVIVPNDKAHWLELRAKDITSTEIGALFGISPYLTKFELWHRKRYAQVVEIEQNERMKWGTRLEDAIARGIGEDQEWKIRRVNRYVRVPDFRIGSSFDFEIVGHDSLLEIKNVDGLAFREGWLVDGENIEAPAHIELQVQHQLAVSGKSACRIGALVGGNSPIILVREAKPEIGQAIVEAAKEFWRSVDADEPPAPDFRRDASFIGELYAAAQAGKSVDMRDDQRMVELVRRYQEAGRAAKEAEAERDAAKAEMLTLIGDAEKVLGAGFSISAGVIAGGTVSFERKPYRGFRVSVKKEKATQ